MAKAEFSFVIGTQAEWIKLKPLILRLQARKKTIHLIATGQHRWWNPCPDPADFQPDVVLSTGPGRSTPLALFLWFCAVFLRIAAQRMGPTKPLPASCRFLIIHGDTLSTLLGALLGRLYQRRVCHVEAGLRSERLFEPFPEEIIRRTVSLLSSYAFSPNEWSLHNLGKKPSFNMGAKTLLDSVRDQLEANKSNPPRLLLPSPFFIAVLHRHENLRDLSRTKLALSLIQEQASKRGCLFLLHANTRASLERYGFLDEIKKHPAIHPAPLLSFSVFLEHLAHAEFLMTDGGSNQEEASYLGVPCLLLRRVTERREGLDKNVVLGKFDPRILQDFFDHYPRHRIPFHLEGPSPSDQAAAELIRMADCP